MQCSVLPLVLCHQFCTGLDQFEGDFLLVHIYSEQQGCDAQLGKGWRRKGSREEEEGCISEEEKWKNGRMDGRVEEGRKVEKGAV